jgi:hypothetical protein
MAMANATAALEAAMSEVDRLRRILKKTKTRQVRSTDERALAKATASAWFANHRSSVESVFAASELDTVDDAYRTILENSDRHGARPKYVSTLAALKRELIRLRTECLRAKPHRTSTSDQAPDFSPLIADPAMQQILISRWNECLLCLTAQASLAATVMMGGLLEALLLARINRENDKSAIFTAKAAPKNPKTKATKPLGEWMLNDFIQVLSEIKWITVSATAVGAVLRDYRNYIHPQKQLSHNMHLTPQDASLFWEVTKNIARQVVTKAP